MIALLAFAAFCALAALVLAALELLTEPAAPVEHFTPLAEMYQPRHAAPAPFPAWRDR